MRPLERVEMWVALALEATTLAPAYEAHVVAGGPRDARLDMRLAAARGLGRGLNHHQLPFPAWEAGKEFLTLLDGLLNDDNLVAVRLGHVDPLVVVAGRLVGELRTCAARPRADLDD
jgi:hypothetical protein